MDKVGTKHTHKSSLSRLVSISSTTLQMLWKETILMITNGFYILILLMWIYSGYVIWETSKETSKFKKIVKCILTPPYWALQAIVKIVGSILKWIDSDGGLRK